MPVYIALSDVTADSLMRDIVKSPVVSNQRISNTRPAHFIQEGTLIPDGLAPMGRFRAPNLEVAWQAFRHFMENGFPPGDPERVVEYGSDAAGDDAPYWRFRGDVKYL